MSKTFLSDDVLMNHLFPFLHVHTLLRIRRVSTLFNTIINKTSFRDLYFDINLFNVNSPYCWLPLFKSSPSVQQSLKDFVRSIHSHPFTVTRSALQRQYSGELKDVTVQAKANNGDIVKFTIYPDYDSSFSFSLFPANDPLLHSTKEVKVKMRAQAGDPMYGDVYYYCDGWSECTLLFNSLFNIPQAYMAAVFSILFGTYHFLETGNKFKINYPYFKDFKDYLYSEKLPDWCDELYKNMNAKLNIFMSSFDSLMRGSNIEFIKQALHEGFHSISTRTCEGPFIRALSDYQAEEKIALVLENNGQVESVQLHTALKQHSDTIHQMVKNNMKQCISSIGKQFPELLNNVDYNHSLPIGYATTVEMVELMVSLGAKTSLPNYPHVKVHEAYTTALNANASIQVIEAIFKYTAFPSDYESALDFEFQVFKLTNRELRSQLIQNYKLTFERILHCLKNPNPSTSNPIQKFLQSHIHTRVFKPLKKPPCVSIQSIKNEYVEVEEEPKLFEMASELKIKVKRSISDKPRKPPSYLYIPHFDNNGEHAFFVIDNIRFL